jgi:hypothetical protein
MKFQLPKNIISNSVLKNVLYLVSLSLAVSYIINEQSLALISLILIACGVYIMNKSLVIALFVSIIITNLLLAMNYLKEFDIVESNENINKPPKEEQIKAKEEQIKAISREILSKIQNIYSELIKAIYAVIAIGTIIQKEEIQKYKDVNKDVNKEVNKEINKEINKEVNLAINTHIVPLIKEFQITLNAVKINTSLSSIKNDTLPKTLSLAKLAKSASNKLLDIQEKMDENPNKNTEIYSKIKEAKLKLYNIRYLAEDSFYIAQTAQ